MNFKVTMLMVVTALTVVAFFSQDAEAYTRFGGSNYCSQCHNNFNGPGESTHNLHVNTNGIACTMCHNSIGDNPSTSKCAVCHDPNTIWNLHLTNAGPDGQGNTCATCHAVTGNEVLDWSQLKHHFE